MFTKYALEWLTETAILDSVNNFVSTYRFARYFKKGIAIKHMLIYSKYFGFADHLWRHGARYGLCKLSHRVSHINEPHPPPFLFIPICLNAMTDLCINKCTSGKWPQVISNLGLSQKQFKNLFLDFFGITSFVIFAIFCHLLRYDFYTLRFGWILYFYIIIKRSFYVMFSLQSARLNKILLNHCSSTGHNSFIRCNNTHTRGGRHSSVDPCVLTILRPPGSNPKHNINTLLNSI